MNFNDQYCEYPPCVQKIGHTAKVCHEIMKRCRYRGCNDQRGHRKECHFKPENRQAYGTLTYNLKMLEDQCEGCVKS